MTSPQAINDRARPADRRDEDVDHRNGRKKLCSSAVEIPGRRDNSSLDTTAHTFSVVYSAGAATRTIGVDFRLAAVEGTLAEEAGVEVKLYGDDGVRFLARTAYCMRKDD